MKKVLERAFSLLFKLTLVELLICVSCVLVIGFAGNAAFRDYKPAKGVYSKPVIEFVPK